MSFFKKIGNSVKKGVKQVSFKNLVKVGSMIDPTGLVGGIQSAHYAKKEAKELEAQGRAEEAAYMAQLANQQATQAGQNLASYAMNKSVVQSALNGAIGGAGADVVGLTAKTWFSRHWQKLAIGAGALIGVIAFMRMRKNGAKRR